MAPKRKKVFAVETAYSGIAADYTESVCGQNRMLKHCNEYLPFAVKTACGRTAAGMTLQFISIYAYYVCGKNRMQSHRNAYYVCGQNRMRSHLSRQSHKCL